MTDKNLTSCTCNNVFAIKIYDIGDRCNDKINTIHFGD